MDKDKKRIPGFKIIGLIGITIGVGIAMLGVAVNISLLVPTALLFAFFSLGYVINGKVKDGVKWAGGFLAFLVFVVLLSYIRK